eukprot:COSAG01_NODE_229_length_21089_cov_575.019194_25_plen_98_part_00
MFFQCLRRTRGVDPPGLRKYDNVGESQPVLMTQVGVTLAGVTFLYALTGTLGYALFGTVTVSPRPRRCPAFLASPSLDVGTGVTTVLWRFWVAHCFV